MRMGQQVGLGQLDGNDKHEYFNWLRHSSIKLWRHPHQVLVAQSYLTLWFHELEPARLLCPWNFPGKNTGAGCHFLLQGIFPPPGLKQGLLHCMQMLYHLNHQGRPTSKVGTSVKEKFKPKLLPLILIFLSLKLGKILLKIEHLQLKFLIEMHLSFCSVTSAWGQLFPNLFSLEILFLGNSPAIHLHIPSASSQAPMPVLFLPSWTHSILLLGSQEE